MVRLHDSYLSFMGCLPGKYATLDAGGTKYWDRWPIRIEDAEALAKARHYPTVPRKSAPHPSMRPQLPTYAGRREQFLAQYRGGTEHTPVVDCGPEPEHPTLAAYRHEAINFAERHNKFFGQLCDPNLDVIAKGTNRAGSLVEIDAAQWDRPDRFVDFQMGDIWDDVSGGIFGTMSVAGRFYGPVSRWNFEVLLRQACRASRRAPLESFRPWGTL
jgi:hypothetical protein